ncbi:MAG: hypothetical protein CVU06_04425 [Bacteroidetes bacterium HGW-Bacteroidetes-22]|nr:MAG: hypothetical protein CVU06_04425 [Bacteroidetes bacterium HGW-Bacteroidetes-22]
MGKMCPINTAKFRFEFDSSTGILFKYYYGPITIDDLTGSWDYAIENKLIPATVKGFILDYREAYFRLSSTDREEIPRYYKRRLNVFGSRKIAILTLNPKDIVVPILVRRQDSGYHSQPFSTLEAAICWILGEIPGS